MSAIDPICGMAVEESKAAATYNYKGKTYYFCNIRCKEKFEKDPEAALSLAHIPHPTSQQKAWPKTLSAGWWLKRSAH